MKRTIFRLKRSSGIPTLGWAFSLLVCASSISGFATKSAVAQPPGTSSDDYEAQMLMEEEMEMEMGYEDYGSGSGYGSNSGYGATAKAPPLPPILLKADPERISTALTSSLQSILGPLPPGAVSSTPPLERDSVVAYQNGDYPLALALYFANAIVDPDTAGDTFSTGQYNSNLRRPIWATRFGVAIAVRGDDTATRSPIKAGTKSASGMGMGMGMSERDFGNPDAGMESMMEQEMMEQEMMEQQMMEQQMMSGGMNGGMMNRGMPSAAAAAPTVLERPMLDVAADELMANNVGLVAEMFASEFDSRYRAGKFGNALTSVTPRAPVKKRRTSVRGAAEETEGDSSVHPTGAMAEMVDEVPDPTPLWQPGLMFLGEVGSDEALAAGKRLGLDFLIQFDVIIKEDKSRNRGGNAYGSQAASVENTARIRLYHVGSGKSLGTTKAISSKECAYGVARRQFPSNEEYVEGQSRGLWIAIDRYAASKPLPELSPDSARVRVGQLFADRSGDVLRMLTEVRMYQSRGWLTTPEVEAAFDVLAGSRGLSLLYAPKAEQRQLVRELIVKSLKAASGE